MPIPVTDDMLDTKTPEDVVIRSDAREPNFDPTLGIPAKRPAAAALPAAVLPPNRLVTVGDSLTHGFQSLAIFHTDISYPAIIAYEMGCLDQFRRPTYNGFGGLPLNLEFLIRDLESEFGDQISWWELPLAYFRVHHFLSQLEDWWERGPGSQVPIATQIKHNLGVYGWDLRDALSKTTDWCQKRIKPPDDSFFAPMVQNANERAALRVLPQSPLQNVGTLGAAEQLSQQGGTADGIETLLVLLGANNVLDSVVRLKVVWSQDPGYDDLASKTSSRFGAPRISRKNSI